MEYGATGHCPTVTRVTRKFQRKSGWHASKTAPIEQDSEIAIVDRPGSSKETAQLVHCKLVVGACQLSTVLQVVDSVDLPDRCVLKNWHIHAGEKDLEALQRDAQDAEICYLAANPKQGDIRLKRMQQGALETLVCLPVLLQ